MVADALVGTVKPSGGDSNATREELLFAGAEGLAERFQHKLDAFEYLYCQRD